MIINNIFIVSVWAEAWEGERETLHDYTYNGNTWAFVINTFYPRDGIALKLQHYQATEKKKTCTLREPMFIMWKVADKAIKS